MDAEELKARTKGFALRILKLVAALPNTIQGRAVGGQLVERGRPLVLITEPPAGVGQSRNSSQNWVVEEEADESAFWMELIIEGTLWKPKRVISNHQLAIGNRK